jgi:hypothetical protein
VIAPSRFDLDHPSRLLTLPAAERAQEHHASVVDQDICATEVQLDSVRGSYHGVTVGDVCCDGQCPLTELGGQLLQEFDATGQQR